MATNELRAQLKATSIKKLKKQVDTDNSIIGAQSSNEYLNLEDGKTLKVRIFPAHPGLEDFYVVKKCYWLSVEGRDGDLRRTFVLDSKVHGGTAMDVVEEYVKMAKAKFAKDATIIDALTGNKQNQDSLNPTNSWLCYADKVSSPDNELRAKVWEFKKMVRDALNRLAFSEEEDESIEIDPFTDVDEGLPVMVKYMKNPNKKKGEQYYEVSFPKKSVARPLTDEEIEYFMSLRPLTEILKHNGIKDFERALEGLQNFDEVHEIGMFENEDWLEKLEAIKAQYDEEEDESSKPTKTTPKKKVAKKVVEDDEEEEEDEPISKPVDKLDIDDEEDEEEEDEEEGDEFDAMNRVQLKKHISSNELEIVVKKSMTDDEIRDAIRNYQVEEDEVDDEEEDDEVEEDETPKNPTLDGIRARLAGKK